MIKRPVLLQIVSLPLLQHRALFSISSVSLSCKPHFNSAIFSVFATKIPPPSSKCLQPNPRVSASSAPNLYPTTTLESSIPPSEVLEWLQKPGPLHPTLPQTSDTQHQCNTMLPSQMPSRRQLRSQISRRPQMLSNNSRTLSPHISLPTPLRRSPPPFLLCSPSFETTPRMPWTGRDSPMQMPRSNTQEI